MNRVRSHAVIGNRALENENLSSTSGQTGRDTSTKLSLSLNNEAYISACEINDTKNMSIISASILETYLESNDESFKLKFWIRMLEDCIKFYSDNYLVEILSQAKNKLK